MTLLTNHVKREFLATCAQIKHGSLHLTDPEGQSHYFGAGAPEAEMKINDWSAISAAAARGDVGLGEAFVAGLWDTPSVQTFTEMALLNLEEFSGYAYASFWNALKFRVVDRILRVNSKRGAARNIRAHYDVGNEFYQTWLDETMTYSSAIFEGDAEDLSQAQTRKYDRILNKLSGGERVLEIGCGWGGFAERAADQGRNVTGLTISPSQKGFADARLDGRAEIRLQDYRETGGTFENIVSIEMIEAVGERYWPTYFSTIKQRLAEGGHAMVQAITVPDDYFPTYKKGSDFIRQYTFPGGMLLSDEVIKKQAAAAGLRVNESFGFGTHYAKTCATWDDRLQDALPRLKTLGYEGAFIRNWRYYLGICAAAFSTKQTDVVQVDLVHA